MPPVAQASPRPPAQRGFWVLLLLGCSFACDAGLSYVIRSHEIRESMHDTGFMESHDGKTFTIFSASDYCGTVRVSCVSCFACRSSAVSSLLACCAACCTDARFALLPLRPC